MSVGKGWHGDVAGLEFCVVSEMKAVLTDSFFVKEIVCPICCK